MDSGNKYVAQKDNSSSVYVDNISNYYVHVSVYGRSGHSTNDEPVGYLNDYNPTYQTVNVTIPGNNKREILQYVKEIGYPYVAINFSSYSGMGNGWWSPDTCGSYPPANP